MLHIEFPRYKLRMQAAFTLMPWDLFLGESSRSSRLRPNRSLGFLLCFRNNFSQRYISIHLVTLCTGTITPKFLNEWRTVVIVYTWAVKISPQHPCFCTRYHNRRQSFSTNDIMSSIGHKHIYRAQSFWIFVRDICHLSIYRYNTVRCRLTPKNVRYCDHKKKLIVKTYIQHQWVCEKFNYSLPSLWPLSLR